MTHDNPQHERRWWILGALIVAQLMIVLDATIVNIALPSAQADLGFSNEDRQWIITAYSLAFGALLLLGGKLGDLFGRKRMLIVGLVGFALASAIGGAAQSFTMLAASRALQGVFAALLAPAVLSLLTTTFTESRERNQAFGIFGGVLACGASVGLLLGGVLTQWFDWRAVMYVNVPIAIGAVAAVVFYIADSRETSKSRIDVAGVITVTLGLFAVVFGFSNAETEGWGDALTIGSLVGGVVLLGLFIWIESRVANPLLPLRVLLDWNRGGAYLTMAIAGIAMFGTFLFLTYYLQGIMGYSPIRTGAAFLPMTIVLMVTAIGASTVLRPRFGPRPLVATGMALGAAGMVLLSRLGVNASYAVDVVPALLLSGLGMGLVFSSAANNATYGVRPEDASVASATTNASQQIGGSLGAALLSTVAATATADYMTSHSTSSDLVAQATVHGFTTGFAWSAAIFAIGAVVALVTFRKSAPTGLEVSSEPVLVH